MKFYLVDRIDSIEPLKRPDGTPCGRIVTSKALSLAEEYLADHFPAFPVMPGVLMLEALTQSAAWLVRVRQDFRKSIIVLSAARNVRYTSFVQPGNILRCEAEATEIGESAAKFKAAGFVGDVQTVSARLELRCFNLAEKTPSLADADRAIIEQMRQRFKLIGGPGAMERAGASKP
jgi:3-hydroxyacyl-[acyl-carrier-protein] dehydratase